MAPATACTYGTEASGVYEAEDTKCKAGQYDFRLDKDYNVIVIIRDQAG